MKRKALLKLLLGLAIIAIMDKTNLILADADQVTVTYDAGEGDFQDGGGTSYGSVLTENVEAGEASNLYINYDFFTWTDRDSNEEVLFPLPYFESSLESEIVGSTGVVEPKRPGYALVGWTVKDRSGNIIDTIPGNEVTKESIKALSGDKLRLLKEYAQEGWNWDSSWYGDYSHFKTTQDVTLSAIWEKGHDITFINEYESYSYTKGQTKTYSENMFIFVGKTGIIPYSAGTFEGEGYFVGYKDRATGALYKKGDIIPTDKDMTLETVIEPAALITYDPGEKPFSEDALRTLGLYPENADTSGITGWVRSDNYSDNDIEGNKIRLNNGSVQVQAYESKELGVGEINSIHNDILYSEGLDYFVCGWKLKGDSSGKVYKYGESFKVTSNATFEAVWGKNLSIAYRLNGGEMVYGTNNRYDTDFLSESAIEGTDYKIYEYVPYNRYFHDMVGDSDSHRYGYPVRPGYRFTGWIDKTDQKLYNPGDIITIKNSMVLEAVWERSDERDYNAYIVMDNRPLIVYNANGGSFEDKTEGRLFENSSDDLRAFYNYKDDIELKVGYFEGYSTDSYDNTDYKDDNGYKMSSSLILKDRPGYKFIGWKPEGSDRIYQQGDTFNIPNLDGYVMDCIFTAQWLSYADTYPKDAETIDVSSLKASVTGTLTTDHKDRIYKFVIPEGKSMKLDLSTTGTGTDEVTINKNSWGAGGRTDWLVNSGVNLVKQEDDYTYENSIGSGIEFNKSDSFYLNEGTYFLEITAEALIPDEDVDEKGNKIYVSTRSNTTGYLTYNYTADLILTEVDDISKGKQNGPLFKHATDINVGSTVQGVTALCTYGGVHGNSVNLGSVYENYRFVLDHKTSITAELSNYNSDALYTKICFYKEGNTPYYADKVASNEDSIIDVGEMINGKFIEYITETHSLTSELEPGTYFLVMEINDGTSFEMHYNGTPYTLSLTSTDSKNIGNCTVSAISAKAYTGSAITPAVTVKDGKTTLKKGTDYSVSYANNTKVGTATVIITGKGSYSGTLKTNFTIKNASLKYRAYVQKKNWMTWQTAKISGSKPSGMAGTTDNLRMETIQMKLSGVKGKVEYRAYCAKKGWTQWATTSNTQTYAGTKGESRRVELLQLRTSGEIATLYDIYFRAYSEKLGWLGWAKNGEKAGTQGYAYKLEAFQVNLVRKGETFKITSDKTRSFYDKTKDGTNPK